VRRKPMHHPPSIILTKNRSTSIAHSDFFLFKTEGFDIQYSYYYYCWLWAIGAVFGFVTARLPFLYIYHINYDCIRVADTSVIPPRRHSWLPTHLVPLTTLTILHWTIFQLVNFDYAIRLFLHILCAEKYPLLCHYASRSHPLLPGGH